MTKRKVESCSPTSLEHQLLCIASVLSINGPWARNHFCKSWVSSPSVFTIFDKVESTKNQSMPLDIPFSFFFFFLHFVWTWACRLLERTCTVRVGLVKMTAVSFGERREKKRDGANVVFSSSSHLCLASWMDTAPGDTTDPLRPWMWSCRVLREHKCTYWALGELLFEHISIVQNLSYILSISR